MKLGSPTEAGTQGPVVRCDLLSQWVLVAALSSPGGHFKGSWGLPGMQRWVDRSFVSVCPCLYRPVWGLVEERGRQGLEGREPFRQELGTLPSGLWGSPTPELAFSLSPSWLSLPCTQGFLEVCGVLLWVDAWGGSAFWGCAGLGTASRCLRPWPAMGQTDSCSECFPGADWGMRPTGVRVQQDTVAPAFLSQCIRLKPVFRLWATLSLKSQPQPTPFQTVRQVVLSYKEI